MRTGNEIEAPNEPNEPQEAVEDVTATSLQIRVGAQVASSGDEVANGVVDALAGKEISQRMGL
jgi:hypothetical protein